MSYLHRLKLSIIIAAYNEESYLPATLDAINATKSDDSEVGIWDLGFQISNFKFQIFDLRSPPSAPVNDNSRQGQKKNIERHPACFPVRRVCEDRTDHHDRKQGCSVRGESWKQQQSK